ncbi:hypothetical protein BC827DRAFT_566304 [Russula dissimulans]|nr:hypothetical protein BC827DRAFT_566304 [Russula dissimulans]
MRNHTKRRKIEPREGFLHSGGPRHTLKTLLGQKEGGIEIKREITRQSLTLPSQLSNPSLITATQQTDSCIRIRARELCTQQYSVSVRVMCGAHISRAVVCAYYRDTDTLLHSQNASLLSSSMNSHQFSPTDRSRRIIATRLFPPRVIISTVHATISRIFSEAQRMWNELSICKKGRRPSLRSDEAGIPSSACEMLQMISLEIFHHHWVDALDYSLFGPWEWHRLPHMCRRWRSVIFSSPRRLDLHMVPPISAITHPIPCRRGQRSFRPRAFHSHMQNQPHVDSPVI